MSLRKIEEESGKPARVKHGIYAYLDSGKLPSGRAWLRVQGEIEHLRAALIEQYGGTEKIQPAVLCLIESAIEGLTIQKLSALYVKKAGILRRDHLKEGDLALHTVLSGSFIAYANLVRLNLEAAARLADRKPSGAGTEDVLTYAQRVYPDKPADPQSAEKGPEMPQDRLSPEDTIEDADDSDAPTEGESNDKGKGGPNEHRG